MLYVVACAAKVAHADEIVLGLGPSMNGSPHPAHASVGYERLVTLNFSILAEATGIFDAPFNGAGAIVFNARVETESGLFIRVGAGPMYVARTDDRISSNVNANLQAVVGVISKGFYIGGRWWHGSNAGFVPPNLGRDYIGACVGISI
jgi:hypothetical protein